jgi:hypothetical protein
VLVLAFLTAGLFFSPDGAKMIKSIDREVFTGTSAITVAVVWIVLLRVLFKRKKGNATE